MWYWKINQAIDLLTKIEENTREYSVGNKVEKEEVKKDGLDWFELKGNIMEKNKNRLGIFLGGVTGIILARVITRYFVNDMPEYINFLVTAFLPTIGLLVGHYIQTKNCKNDSK